MASLRMNREEREAFLAEVHVAIISITDGDRAPLTAPVWYAYEPGGEIRFTTGSDSRKIRLLRQAGRMSLCVQRETVPYAYVTVEGPVEIGAPSFEDDIRLIAVRYLGERAAAAYLGARADAARSVLVRLKPERWLTVDYAKR